MSEWSIRQIIGMVDNVSATERRESSGDIFLVLSKIRNENPVPQATRLWMLCVRFFCSMWDFFRRLTLFYHLGLWVFGDLFEFSSEIRLFSFNCKIATFQLQFGLSYIRSPIQPSPNHQLGSINIPPELN